MNLLLVRRPNSDGCTLGELFLNGTFFCFTLEPDDDRPKFPAIPLGTYRVAITMSTRFKRMLPQILNVPGRLGIRIHPGNTDADTEGCILLGTSQTAHAVGNSRTACELFQSAIAKPLANGEIVMLTITEQSQALRA